jgi:hypothetical protein
MAQNPFSQDLLARLFQQGPDTESVQPPMAQEPGPGAFKDNPEAAIQYISQKLGTNAQGQLTQRVPVNQPLLALLGVKRNVPVQSADYYQKAKAEGLALPNNLPMKPDGTPFLSDDHYRLAAAGAKNEPLDAAGLTEFGAAFFEQAGSPEQQAAWNKLPDATKAKLASALPGFRTKRQDAFAQTEILSNGDAVQKNINDGKYYYAGTQMPYDGQVKGQFLPKTQKNMSDSTVIQLGKTQTLLNSIQLAKQAVDPSKLGLWQGTFNKTIASYTNKDPKAAAMFRQLKTVFTEVTHDLYGGTLTGNELDQATDLLFSQYQSPEAILAALDVQENKMTNRLSNVQLLMKAGNVRGAEAIAPTAPKAGNTPKAMSMTPEQRQARIAELRAKLNKGKK